MDKRLKEINLRLSEYSLGKFDKRLKLSPRLDDIDAIISGINMLGEELKAITTSRNYFTNIFNSVSDMVFILNTKGVIEDANKPAEEQLKYEPGSLKGKTIHNLHKGNLSSFKNITRQLKNENSLISIDSILHTKEGEIIPVRMNASYFKDELKKQLILLTATDITFQMKTENLIIRAIIDTQEKERRRLAKDLHDSLTQQLSAIKFYVSATADLTRNQKQKTILLKSNEALTEVIADMRNICFNLMPKTLEEFGLLKAVQEFCNHFLYNKKANFIIEQNTDLPEFSPELKTDLYRIIQEFINNAIKHGKANKISISFSYRKKILEVILIDNGKGFDCNQPGKGMGLQNVQSRVKSHSGTLNMVSNIGKGTFYTITIPINV